LAQGHYDILAEEKNDPDPLKPSRRDQEEKEVVNLGIAVVTPAKKIKEVLYQPKLVELRQQLDRSADEVRGTTTPD
jgi:hypothetical protein